VNFKKFVPLQSVKRIDAKVDKRDGKKVYASARLVDGDTHQVHAEGSAIFLAFEWDKK